MQFLGAGRVPPAEDSLSKSQAGIRLKSAYFALVMKRLLRSTRL